MANTLKPNKRVLASFVIIAFLASVMAVTMSAYALQPVTITIEGPTGTLTKNQDDILAMPSVTGFAGTKGSGGNIGNKGTYVGVSVLSLCNLVGGINDNCTINLIDRTGNFIVSFTYQQVNNGQGFNTYNPDTGISQTATQPLTLILAYSYNGTELSSSNGPLRAVVLSPDGLVTDGNLWNKQVERIQVIDPNVVPEYPITAIFVLIAGFLTFVAIVASKKVSRASIPNTLAHV